MGNKQSNQQNKAPKLYNPIPNVPASKNGLPSRDEMAELQRLGYIHDLNFLPPFEDGLNDVLNSDPLRSYDAYFGVDELGKSISTKSAAQSLQKQTNSVLLQQQNRNQQQQQVSTYQQHTTSMSSTSAYYQQGQSTPILSSQHSYSTPRSAPYGPIATPNNVSNGYQAQQWQLDKFQRGKSEKNANERQNGQNKNQNQSNSTTALSVLSSTK